MSAVQEKQEQETIVVLQAVELETMIRRVVREEITQALQTLRTNTQSSSTPITSRIATMNLPVGDWEEMAQEIEHPV